MSEAMPPIGPPIGEDDLHAYVDDQLAASRRQAVEDYLAGRPEAARKVAAWRAQKQALRQAFAAPEAEPLPPRLTLAGIIEERRRPRRTPWLIAASVVLALAAGAAGGAFLSRAWGPDRTQVAMTLLEQEALASHVVYATDRRHPIEVPGTEKPHLSQWLSNRLSRSVAPPDLSALGYRLIGGRLLATERGGAAALFMYEDDAGHRISVLLRPMAPDLRAPVTNIGKDQVGVQAWIANGLGIAVAAAAPAGDLARIASDVQRELGAS